MIRRPRVRRAALVAALAVLIVGAGPATARAASPGPAPAKVVLIVGPAGAATPYYKRLADETAAAAAKLTTNVVKVYSPDATWPAVKAALQGASVVVYLGHGNGWPSIYRDSLYPATQDGFGLNPHEGDANAHQYFGEEQIGSEIKLARNAVVVFSHLCYASGNSEPGLDEGTLEQAQQRVDNYAAGFFRAGAGAVIADAYLSPTYYVQAVLRGRAGVDAIWRSAPNQNDHFLRFDSQRTKGAIAEMDPDQVDSGFHRSIVVKPSLASAQVLRGAVGRSGDVTPVVEPSLTGLGVTFGTPDLTSPPTVGAMTTLILPLPKEAVAVLPANLMVATQWDLLEASPATGIDAGAGTPAPGPSATPSPSGSTGGGTGAASGGTGAASGGAGASGTTGASDAGGGSSAGGAAPAPSSAPAGDTDPGTTATHDAPGIDLIVPERPGQVVAPVPVSRLRGGGLALPVRLPASPGLYRLVATVHAADGVAFDAATQALVPALVIRVIGGEMAAYTMPSTATASAGTPFLLAVRVTNLGATVWGHPASSIHTPIGEATPATRAMLVARWVDLAGGAAAATPSASTAVSLLPAGLGPGTSADLDVALTGPTTPGEYLLVLDVVDPQAGSLAATGVPPGIVRFTVSP